MDEKNVAVISHCY